MRIAAFRRRPLGLLPLVALLGLIVILLVLVVSGEPKPFSYAFHWPIKPFDRQHPIRGAFGDPRTLAVDRPFGKTAPGDSGRYSLHSGVDVVAVPGTPVYPVVSGRVALVHADEIVVDSDANRQFYYYHLRGNVKLGQDVVVDRTVLGWIQRPFNHVHLGEVDGRRNINPLARGRLEPYFDHTTPRAIALDIQNGASPHVTQGGPVSNQDELAIEAVDAPAMAVPGPFAGMPQTPAFVEWRLSSGGKWSGWTVAADFRQTLPSSSISPAFAFWSVYEAGTYQNFPVFDHRLFWKTPGRYLFRVALQPSQLAPGHYELEARVAVVRDNASTTIWPIEITGKP